MAWLIPLLRNVCVAAGLTHADAVESPKKSQSFVSKCAVGEWHIDVIDLLGYCHICVISAKQILASINSTSAWRSGSED